MPNINGREYAFGVNNGAGNPQNLLTKAVWELDNPAATGYQEDTVLDNSEPKPNYIWYIFGIIVLLAIFKFASEHEKSGVDPAV
jgi:hypothetical protein